MMTAEQFQSEYHRFRTSGRAAALSALRAVECEEPVIVVQIGAEYCLMLRRAAQTVLAMGIGTAVTPE